MPLLNIKKDIKDIERFDEILLVLFEEGLDFLVHRIKLRGRIPIHKHLKSRLNPKTDPVPVRLRKAFERLGPTFVKLGQMLSVRPDFIPHEYIVELEKLQDHVPCFAFGKVKNIVRDELGKDYNKIFRSFDKKPVASASLSQVHIAHFKSGEKVAVKIQRSGIKDKIDSDLDILFYLAHLLEEHVPETRLYNPVKVVKEFAAWTRRELNFKTEASNADLFRNNFRNVRYVKIPKIYWKYTTEKILVMEYIEGIKISDIVQLDKKKYNRKKLGLNGVNSFFKQVLVDGFFHADPHPANIFALKNNTIAYIDFGMVGRLDEDLRKKLCSGVVALIEKRTEKLLNFFIDVSMKTEYTDLPGFKEEARMIVERWYGSSLKENSITLTFYNILNSATKHGLSLPPSVVLFSKALFTLEGTGMKLYPGFNMSKEAKPFIQDVISKQYNPVTVGKKLTHTLVDNRELLEDLPDHLINIMSKLENGEIKVNVDKKDVISLQKELSRENNLRTMGMIVAGLLIASALIFKERSVVFFGVSLPEIGMLLAFILIVWIFFNMFRK